ncbi:hypothetical protein Mpsy_2306 [Methanolobus psychrophilus R15]|nr:hypothetical protein Mpsy_2306 [Methanolobus psychrophilus R15]
MTNNGPIPKDETKKDNIQMLIDGNYTLFKRSKLEMALIESGNKETVYEETSGYVIYKDQIKKIFEDMVECPLNDGELESILNFLIGTYSKVDYSILLSSEKIFNFIAKVESKHPVLLKKHFEHIVNYTAPAPKERIFTINKEIIENGKFDIPHNVNFGKTHDTHGGMIIITDDYIPGAKIIKPGEHLDYTQIPMFIEDGVKIKTTEKGSVIECCIFDTLSKQFNPTKIDLTKAEAFVTWFNLFRSMTNCTLRKLDKTNKESFEKFIAEFIDDLKTGIDSSSTDKEAIWIALDAYAENLRNCIWTHDLTVMQDDKDRKTIYMPEVILNDDTPITIPAAIIIEACRVHNIDYGHLKWTLEITPVTQSRGARTTTVDIPYKYVRTGHIMATQVPTDNEPTRTVAEKNTSRKIRII